MLLLAGGVVLAGHATPAFACKPTANIWANGSESGGGMGCPDGGGGDEKDGKTTWSKGGQPPLCVWIPQPDYPALPGEPVNGPDGMWYAKFCKFGRFKTLAEFEAEMLSWDESMSVARGEMLKRSGIEYRFFKKPPPARPTPEQVMYWVAGNLPFPSTHIAVSPKATANAVNFPTWVWLVDDKGKYDPTAYAVKSKTISLFGYSMRWQIVPTVSIDPGDGGTPPSCNGVGVPWSESADESAACAVTYSKAGKYMLTATVGWTVQWWLGGVPQNDISGPDNTATLPVTVGEIQTVGR
jgi:hypothetical protein